MLFSEVIGQENLKQELVKSHSQSRIPHCQLFVSPEGTGGLAMAIAFARYVIEKSLPANSSSYKISELKHPDLHVVFPNAATKEVKSKPFSDLFLEQWRGFVHNDPYGNLLDWYSKLGVENKQGKIGNDDAENLLKKMSLKSYEGGWKVAVIWMAEKLNQAATNKLLKIVEEPPEKTLFLFVCESEETLLETLVSRCQIFRLGPLSKNKIEDYLIKKGVKTSVAKKAAINCAGNLRTALKSVYEIKNEKEFEDWFLKWVRTAFKVKSNKEEVLALVEWSKTMSKEGREIQKSFLTFSLNIFRNALMKNYGVDSLVTFEPKTDLNFESFSKYVHGNNIEEISQELESAITGIQSNGNPNFIFMDLSLKLTRLIQ